MLIVVCIFSSGASHKEYINTLQIHFDLPLSLFTTVTPYPRFSASHMTMSHFMVLLSSLPTEISIAHLRMPTEMPGGAFNSQLHMWQPAV